MSGATKLRKSLEEDHFTNWQGLERRFVKSVSVPELSAEITRLLKLLGKKAGTFENVGQYLAEKLAPRFAHKSDELRRLIKYRPEQLAAVAHAALMDEVERELMPAIMKRKKSRRKITTADERIRRMKAAKNRHERLRRNYIIRPGWIEREFAERSGYSLLNPDNDLPLTGPCLDEVFHGGFVKMCYKTYSLQSLFGLRRKKLCAAGRPIRRGRETLYGYAAILRCMVTLLRQSGPAAPWLPDPARRQTVLSGVLFRARQEGTPEIRDAFTKALAPFLS